MYKQVDNQRIKMTDEEIAQYEQDRRNTFINPYAVAKEIYKKLRNSFIIKEGDIYEFDLESLMLFENQVKLKTDDIKVMGHNSVIAKVTKAKALKIYDKINLHLESLSEAYNKDVTEIDNDNLSILNLKAIQASQEALK